MFRTVDTEDISRVTSLREKSSTSSDAQESPDNSQAGTQNRELTVNMLIKEMIFCVALALTTYGALHNTPSKISKHPQAVSFFSQDSLVTDWYRGHLSQALATINQADVAFVMYYAPWDAESQYVRGEFEKAAEILGDRVHFAAINCWNPGSECRLQHNKIPSWPILMVYTVTSRGMLYKGQRDAHSMVKFLELVMRPLKRVASTEDLVHLLSICDAVAVGYTPLSYTTKYYSIWYQVALKVREYDNIGEICFAAVTSEELAYDLGVEVVPNARLMVWNDTKEYLSEDTDLSVWNETTLTQWVLENFSQPVARVIPMWKKAFSFARFVDGNPILILFTPLNPVYEQLPAYALLREVAMEYYSCKNNETAQWTSELIKLQQVQRLLYQKKDIKKYCDENFRKSPRRRYRKGIESKNNKYPWYNTTKNTQRNGVFNFLVKPGLEISKVMESGDEFWFSSLSGFQECNTMFPAERSFYENKEQCQSDESYGEGVDDNRKDDMKTSMLPTEDDPLSSENLFQDHMKHYCKVMKFAAELNPQVVPTRVEGDERTNKSKVYGLACEKNFTMHMIAVDSVQNYHFAESLGVDVARKKDKTAVVILDTKQESQYLLSQDYNAETIRDFIYNFTHKRIKQSYRTHVHDAAHTHYFSPESEVGRGDGGTDVIELDTKSFRRLVKVPGPMTLVVVCGGGCPGSVSRAVGAASRLLRACGVRVRRARIDVRRHDLPAHYLAPHLPTIYVLPADRKREADTRPYPSGVRITSSGVVALALKSLGTPLHLRVRLALCHTAPLITERKTCLKDMREHITAIIGRHLKYWRQAKERDLKYDLYRRLQHLHRVSLHLSLLHSSDLGDKHKQAPLLDSLTQLSKNWDILSTLRRQLKRGYS